MTSRSQRCLSFLAVAVLLSGASVAQARPQYLKGVVDVYPDVRTDVLKIKCNLCHPGKNRRLRNPYGKKVEKALGAKNVKNTRRIREALSTAGKPKVLVKTAAVAVAAPKTKKLKLLIVDGQNNHNWRATTPILKEFLEDSGRFTVDVATSPPPLRIAKGRPKDLADRERAEHRRLWDKFRPKFANYDVVLSNYNGELWPEPVQKGFESFVANGGGLVIVHAANNAFPQWKEFNKMIGLGWRGNGFGDRVTVDDKGKVVRTPKGKGPGAGHGRQHAFTIIVRDAKHPVTKGMPREWMHFKDELYHGQRGPAKNMHILATAFSDKKTGGTGENEPMVWWIPYGKGKVFTTVMGHADYSMQCVGFQIVVERGAEWAATGKVTIPVPRHFPTKTDASVILIRRTKKK
jgi:uncharacterized protein